jgi:hypothetical protein
MSGTLCVRFSPTLKREFADYARVRRVRVATLAKQALRKGVTFR